MSAPAPAVQPSSHAAGAASAAASCAASHELRFESLFHPGRCVSVPCDASGHVDMDRLTERLRNAYLGARAMVGRDYAYPRVQPTH